MDARERTRGAAAPVLTTGHPALARRLWRLWARQAASVVSRMGPHDADPDWQRALDLVEEGAEGLPADKARRVVARARRMTGGRAEPGDRALALRALRTAILLSYAEARPGRAA